MPDPHQLAAGLSVAAVVQGVHRQPGFAEPFGDMVVAAGVFAVTVRQHDHTAQLRVRHPDVVHDLDAAGPGECSLRARCGHAARVTGVPRPGIQWWTVVSRPATAT